MQLAGKLMCLCRTHACRIKYTALQNMTGGNTQELRGNNLMDSCRRRLLFHIAIQPIRLQTQRQAVFDKARLRMALCRPHTRVSISVSLHKTRLTTACMIAWSQAESEAAR